MTKILWNNEGNPLMTYSKTYFATTTGSPEPVKPAKTIEELAHESQSIAQNNL